MDKYCYLAAFAAVPAMVASAENVQFTAKERVLACEVASASLVIQVMEDDSIGIEKKIEPVQQLTQIVRKAQREGVSDAQLKSCAEVISKTGFNSFREFNDHFAETARKWEKSNFKGSARLRKAGEDFVKAYVAD